MVRFQAVETDHLETRPCLTHWGHNHVAAADQDANDTRWQCGVVLELQLIVFRFSNSYQPSGGSKSHHRILVSCLVRWEAQGKVKGCPSYRFLEPHLAVVAVVDDSQTCRPGQRWEEGGNRRLDHTHGRRIHQGVALHWEDSLDLQEVVGHIQDDPVVIAIEEDPAQSWDCRTGLKIRTHPHNHHNRDLDILDRTYHSDLAQDR